MIGGDRRQSIIGVTSKGGGMDGTKREKCMIEYCIDKG